MRRHRDSLVTLDSQAEAKSLSDSLKFLGYILDKLHELYPERRVFIVLDQMEEYLQQKSSYSCNILELLKGLFDILVSRKKRALKLCVSIESAAKFKLERLNLHCDDDTCYEVKTKWTPP